MNKKKDNVAFDGIFWIRGVGNNNASKRFVGKHCFQCW